MGFHGGCMLKQTRNPPVHHRPAPFSFFSLKKAMSFTARRIVTGIDKTTGKSVVVKDGPPPKGAMIDFWTTDSTYAQDVSNSEERASSNV